MEHNKKRNNKGEKDEEDLVDDVLHCSVLTVFIVFRAALLIIPFVLWQVKAQEKEEG